MPALKVSSSVEGSVKVILNMVPEVFNGDGTIIETLSAFRMMKGKASSRKSCA
jgi:hypothetical protein